MAPIKMNKEYLEFLRSLIENKKTITPDSARVLIEHLIELGQEVLTLHKQMSSQTSRITLETIDEFTRILEKYKE